MKMPSLSVLLFFLIFSNCSYAQFRCGARIVDIGDNLEEVLKKCGPPTIQKQGAGMRGEYVPNTGAYVYNPNDQVVIDEWIYNRGSRRLQQYLRFENGILKEIRSLNYGD
jgi:hypothetical protein